MRGPMQDLGSEGHYAAVLCKTQAQGLSEQWSIHKKLDMVERRYNALALELSMFDNLR